MVTSILRTEENMELSTKLFSRRYYRWGVVCFMIYFLLFNTLVSLVIAGPEGAQVVNGQVSIQQSGSNTAITASDKAIINYSSFDITQPETVRFIQPGSNASVLNRILSANPTNINGTLLANGRVFFVNPAGVYIGNGARINVNQLVASGLNISNADFINGHYNFAGGNGAVINNGDISAQQVYLIGKQVTNSGNINCPAGYVVMAAGDRVFLGEPGSDIVLDVEGTSLSDSTNAAVSEVGVLNEGTVEAAGGIIALAAAGDIYSQAISNVGTISASSKTGNAGQISLAADDGTVTNTGTIEASGSEGGQVVIEGSRVGQFGTVHADAAVGNGGNVDLTASDVVALSSDSLTTANAGVNGNGGEVIVYSPDTALFRPDARI
jgi:filamentous hemagglutinin family protein